MKSAINFYSNVLFFRSCSSSRSIKRKRFDDEIVQYSIGIQSGQVNRIGRSRRQSIASANTPTTSTASSSVIPQLLKTPEPTPPLTSPIQTNAIIEPPVLEPVQSNPIQPCIASPTQQLVVNTNPNTKPITDSVAMIPQSPSIQSPIAVAPAPLTTVAAAAVTTNTVASPAPGEIVILLT